MPRSLKPGRLRWLRLCYKNQMPLEFSGKVAVVTGGANGIGLAAARVLAAGGAQLWIFDLERERPEEVARSLGGHGCHVDVTDRATIDAAFRGSGAPGIVVANPGMGLWAPLDEQSAGAERVLPRYSVRPRWHARGSCKRHRVSGVGSGILYYGSRTGRRWWPDGGESWNLE